MGNPRPEIEWFKNGKKFPHWPAEFAVSMSEESGNVEVNKAAMTLGGSSWYVERNGVYGCNASNVHGYVYHEWRVMLPSVL